MALAAADRGAQVDLIHGPLSVAVPRHENINAAAVRSAQDMHDVVMERAPEVDVAIMCAAVADFAPVQTADRKIKKDMDGVPRIELQRTPDILADLGALKTHPFLVGFAAETDDIENNALQKMAKKNCDMICANDVSESGSGFGSETNRLTICLREGAPIRLPMLQKSEAAERILDEIEANL